jgi:hypothetical protein
MRQVSYAFRAQRSQVECLDPAASPAASPAELQSSSDARGNHQRQKERTTETRKPTRKVRICEDQDVKKCM